MPRVVHFEIHSSEPEKAATWYAELFGWKVQHMPQIDYWFIDTTFVNEPGINGGLMRRRGPKPEEGQPVTCFVCTVDVPSVDDYVSRVTEAGGTIALPKMGIPNVGWVAYCKDLDGNIFGLHQRDPHAK